MGRRKSFHRGHVLDPAYAPDEPDEADPGEDYYRQRDEMDQEYEHQ